MILYKLDEILDKTSYNKYFGKLNMKSNTGGIMQNSIFIIRTFCCGLVLMLRRL